MELQERHLVFQILTPCTLNCKLCGVQAPAYRMRGVQYYDSYEDFCLEAECVFKIYDHIRDITISGGEPLMHPRLPEMLAYVLQNFSAQFTTCRIFINGTIIPSEELIKAIHKYARDNFMFVVSDYGEPSCKTDKIAELLMKEKIPYRINKYYGDHQHCNGWVDYGAVDQYRGYTENEVEELAHRCHNATWKGLPVFKGKLHLCDLSVFGADLGYFTPAPDEYIDLFDESVSLESKKAVAAKLGQHHVTACHYCSGFDPEHSPRVPAGEQL